MKKWIEENWDEVVIYLVTLFGAVCEMFYAADLAGTRFHPKWYMIVMAMVAAIIAAWLAENKGILFAKKAGAIPENAKVGRRGNLFWPRMPLAFGFGFVIQAALPSILQMLINAAPSFISATFGGGQP